MSVEGGGDGIEWSGVRTSDWVTSLTIKLTSKDEEHLETEKEATGECRLLAINKFIDTTMLNTI